MTTKTADDCGLRRGWQRFCLVLVAQLLGASLAWAQTRFEEPKPIDVHTGVSIDYGAQLTADGLELYFVSWREFGADPNRRELDNTDIWRVTRQTTEEDWAAPEPVSSLNTPLREDGLTLSADGLTMIFGSVRGGDWDLWQTTRTEYDQPWAEPVNLGPPVNTKGSEYSASLSRDGLSLYLSGIWDGTDRQGTGGQGGSDIWVTTRETPDGDWREPVNLNDGLGTVNSQYNDFWPSISADGLALYFTSDRANHGVQGGEDIWVATRESLEDPFNAPVMLQINTTKVDFGPFVAADGSLYYAKAQNWSGPVWDMWVATPIGPPLLQPGDADQDLDFDQLDLVRVQQAGKYLSGVPATWGEGDWNGAPGGVPGSPPAGNGLFDQLDIIAALANGLYLTGPYAAIASGGTEGDDQTSIIYNHSTGEVAVDAPSGTELTSINIDSAGSVFTGDAAMNLGGSFDNDADNNIFKATFGSSFGSLSFGNVARAGLEEQFLLNDLTVVGSLAGGGSLGDVDLVYVPEPTGAVLASLALVVLTFLARRADAVSHVSRRP